MYGWTISCKALKMVHLRRVEVNEVIFPKRRLDSERIQWASRDKLPSQLREMLARPRESVNIDMRQVLRAQDFGVCGCVFTHNVEFYLRPIPDLIEFKDGRRHISPF